MDYAKVASGYGLASYTVRAIEELKAAIADAKRQSVSTLIDLKVIPKTMTDRYKTWWSCFDKFCRCICGGTGQCTFREEYFDNDSDIDTNSCL